MHDLVTRLFAALLVLYPGIPNDRRSCMLQNRESIIQMAADSATATGVPPSILLMVGFFETHLGCARGSGGCWGSPVDNRHRHVAGTPRRAADDLATSYRVCGTWLGAVSRYRCGLCRCRLPMIQNGYAAAHAIAQARRLVQMTASQAWVDSE